MEKESCEKASDPELSIAKRTPFHHVKYFISEKLPQLGWGVGPGWGQPQEKEFVLDVGCGSGVNTLRLLVPLFPRAEKIFAIDILEDMIGFAWIQNMHPSIQYSVANIENWSTVKQWEGQISKIASINCVQWLKDKRRSFQNMFKLLKSGGEMAFCFEMASPVYGSIWELENNPKWSKFIQCVDNFVSDDHKKDYESSRYKKMLEEIGFDILYFKEEEKSTPFSSDEECREFFASKCALTYHIPSQERENFKDDLLQEVLKLNGRDSSGRPLHRGIIIEVVTRKRDNEETKTIL